jgi:hypothetical protein
MKRDWLRKQLGDEVTDEVVDAIMTQNGTDVNAAKAATDREREKAEKLVGRVGELEEAAKRGLTSDEKWQAQIDDATKARDEAVRDLNRMSAVSVFAEAGISAEEYEPLLAGVVSDDRDATTASAKAIADLVSARVSAAGKASEDRKLAGMKGPQAGKQGDVSTAKEFMALPYEKQVEMKNADPTILSRLK